MSWRKFELTKWRTYRRFNLSESDAHVYFVDAPKRKLVQWTLTKNQHQNLQTMHLIAYAPELYAALVAYVKKGDTPENRERAAKTIKSLHKELETWE